MAKRKSGYIPPEGGSWNVNFKTPKGKGTGKTIDRKGQKFDVDLFLDGYQQVNYGPSRGKNMARRKKTAVNSPNSVGATGTDLGAMPAASRKMRNARNRAITAGTGAQTRKSGYKPMSAKAAQNAAVNYQINKLNSGASITSARAYGDNTGTIRGTGKIKMNKRTGLFERKGKH